MKPTRVYVVDDHPLVRESLMGLIRNQSDLEVCGEAGTAREAFAEIPTSRPDVVIIDLSLGDESGLELIKDLHSRQADLRILVLSMHEENVYAERVLRAGANGYIMKREATELVIAAIRRVSEGKLYLSDALATRLAERHVGRKVVPDSPLELLSDRELEVFRLMGRGQGTQQISDVLHVSPKTVQAYHARMKEKLGLASINELLREAVRWLDLEGKA